MNNLKQVKFCNGHAYRFNGRITRLQDYGLRLNENYNLLSESHIQLMCKYPFMWSILPKGLAYYVYISHIEGNRVTYFIERKIQEKTKKARIFVMGDIFTDAPGETIFSAYISSCSKGHRWKFFLQDIMIEGGKQTNGCYGDRWNRMVGYLHSANTSNKTVIWKALPLFKFPVSIEKTEAIIENEGIQIKRLVMYNMSNNSQKRFTPFIINYTPPDKQEHQEILNTNMRQRMKIIPNDQLPDIYKLQWNSKIIGNACVRTIEQSLKMQHMVKKGEKEAVFEYNPHFQAWEIVV
jgi:hypothetical protein